MELHFYPNCPNTFLFSIFPISHTQNEEDIQNTYWSNFEQNIICQKIFGNLGLEMGDTSRIIYYPRFNKIHRMDYSVKNTPSLQIV